eukprot:jgi/Chrzof1/9311/UNPLg00280.t1
MAFTMNLDSSSQLKRKPEGPPEPPALEFSPPVAYGYRQFPYREASASCQHLQCTTGVYDYAASCVDSNGFIDKILCAVGLCFPPDTTISSAKQIVVASLQAAGAAATLQQDSIYISRLPGQSDLAGSCVILQYTDSSVPANILQHNVCPVLPVLGSGGTAVQGQPIWLKYPGDSAVTKQHRRQCRLQVHSPNFAGLDSNQVACILLAVARHLFEQKHIKYAQALQFYPGLISKPLQSTTAVVTLCNPLSPDELISASLIIQGTRAMGHISATLPVFGSVSLIFRPVPAIQLTGHQVILTANYLGCFLAHCRGISRYKLPQGACTPTQAELTSLQYVIEQQLGQLLPTVGPDLQIVPLKKTAGQHMFLSMYHPQRLPRGLSAKEFLARVGCSLLLRCQRWANLRNDMPSCPAYTPTCLFFYLESSTTQYG